MHSIACGKDIMFSPCLYWCLSAAGVGAALSCANSKSIPMQKYTVSQKMSQLWQAVASSSMVQFE